MRRKDDLVNGTLYHVFNKSIAGYRIFNGESEYLRMKFAVRYYEKDMPMKLSDYLEMKKVERSGFDRHFSDRSGGRNRTVEIVAYCLMPTHMHLVLKQITSGGISTFMGNIQNSYARYFNTKHDRKGPLWQGRFKNVVIEDDEQLIHLTRYIHLNPVTAGLVDSPDKWPYSSFDEYVGKVLPEDKLCCFESYMDISPDAYISFTSERANYQKELARIKQHILN